MGQKVHPNGFRLGTTKTWRSRWFATKDYAGFLHEDLKLRKYVKGIYSFAGTSEIEIERAGQKIKINIYTSRPGIVIGKKGVAIEALKNDLKKMTGKEVRINIKEVKRPETDAQLVAENVALQLERRVSFRRAMKKALTSALKMGAEGIKISTAGRLGGREMARTEWYLEGRLPLHTLRADIDYGFAEASTTYGLIGVKVWIFKGEVMLKDLYESRLKKATSMNEK